MADYVDAYVARTGLDPRPALPVYLAYNFFRIAAILQGIIGRVRDGTATSEFAPAKAAMVRPLADKAWEFAQCALSAARVTVNKSFLAARSLQRNGESQD